MGHKATTRSLHFFLSLADLDASSHVRPISLNSVVIFFREATTIFALWWPLQGHPGDAALLHSEDMSKPSVSPTSDFAGDIIRLGPILRSLLEILFGQKILRMRWTHSLWNADNLSVHDSLFFLFFFKLFLFFTCKLPYRLPTVPGQFMGYREFQYVFSCTGKKRKREEKKLYHTVTQT
jgi:hypothetical protein